MEAARVRRTRRLESKDRESLAENGLERGRSVACRCGNRGKEKSRHKLTISRRDNHASGNSSHKTAVTSRLGRVGWRMGYLGSHGLVVRVEWHEWVGMVG